MNLIFAKNGFVQNDDSDFSKIKKEYSDIPRYFNKLFFETKLSNGKINKRLWLIYSTSKGKAYCGPCLLLNTGTHLGSKEGYDDLKNAITRFSTHEKSDLHKSLL